MNSKVIQPNLCCNFFVCIIIIWWIHFTHPTERMIPFPACSLNHFGWFYISFRILDSSSSKIQVLRSVLLSSMAFCHKWLESVRLPLASCLLATLGTSSWRESRDEESSTLTWGSVSGLTWYVQDFNNPNKTVALFDHQKALKAMAARLKA